MEFQLLGPLTVLDAGAEIRIGGPRERTVLAVLLLERNRVVPVDRLIRALWDDDPPASARGQVHICISALRRRFASCGHDVIATRPPGYLIRVTDGMVDLDRFAAAAAAGREAVAAARPDLAEAHLRAALDLWQGAPLSDIDSAVVRAAVVTLAEERLAVTEEWLASLLALGRHEVVCREAAGLLAHHPLRESLCRLHILALHRSGRTADALEAWRGTRAALVAELGLEPGPELQRLHHDILTGDAHGDGRTPGVPASTRPLPRQLPAAPATFTGRTDVVNRLRQVLDGPEPAGGVVALTGPAGVGKTALAVHIGHLLGGSFPDGQLFVELHGEGPHPEPPGRAVERLLRTMGVASSAIPDSLDERVMLYRTLLAGRRALVIVDDAASESQVRPLLPGSAGCATVVTSRRRLTGLDVTAQVEVGVLTPEAATDLLTTLVGSRITDEPAATGRLIGLCDGLPLALRIAAARLAAHPHWTVADLTGRLADERRRLDELVHGEIGVRPSISLSYEGLDPPARTLFRRLGLLDVPDFAAWVGAPLLDTGADEAHEVLERLVDSRLVEVSTGPGRPVRYRMHDLIRVYSRERLAADEATADRRATLARLLGCVLHLTEETHRREYGGDFTIPHGTAPRRPLDPHTVAALLGTPPGWLQQERPLVVAAVGQAARAGLTPYAWDLAMSAVTLFELGRHFEDWRSTTELALEAAHRAGDRQGEAVMLYSLGGLALAEQRPDAAIGLLDRARAIFEDLGDRYGQALVRRHLAFAARVLGRLDEAEKGYLAARQLLAAANDPVAEAHVLSGLAQIAIERRRFDEAETLLHQALLLCRTTGSQRLGAQLNHRFGELCLARGQLAEAELRFGVVLTTVRDLADEPGQAYARLGLGLVALGMDRLDRAEAQFTSALELVDQTSAPMVHGRLLLALGETYLRAGRTTAAATTLAHALVLFREVGMPVWQARTLHLLGTLHAADDDPVSARSAWESGLRVLAAVSSPDAAELADDLARRLRREAPGDVERGGG